MSRFKEIVETYNFVREQVEDEDITAEKGSELLRNQAIMNIDVTLARMYDLMERKYNDEKESQCK